MGFIHLVFAPLAVIFAFFALCSKTKYNVVFMLASEAFCTILPITAVIDINSRMSAMDYGGIEDIYPTMMWVYIVLFILITVLNAAAIIRKSRKDRDASCE